MNDPDRVSDAPPDVANTIRLIAQMREEHEHDATWVQRLVSGVTAAIATPFAIAVLTLVVAGWVIGNLIAAAHGHRMIDPPPFSGLASAMTIASVYMVILILAAQRREEQLGWHREQLILDLAIRSEQKTTKVIQLLEESRRDNPLVHDRVDPEADAMAQPADPQVAFDAIKKAHHRQQQP